MHLVLFRQSHYHKKWRRNPVLPLRFSLPKRSKNCHSNLAMETGGFSPGGTTSLPLLKPRHNTLYFTPSNRSVQTSNRPILSEISQSLSQLAVVSVSFIWAEILKMSFLSTGKTDFLRFWLFLMLLYPWCALLKISELFLRGGTFRKCFFLSVYLFASPFFCLQLLPYELWGTVFYLLNMKLLIVKSCPWCC